MSDHPDSKRPEPDIVPAVPKASDIDAKVARAIEKYGVNTLPRALLVTLAAVMQNAHGIGPYMALAGVFDFITSNRAQEIGARRTQRLIESLAREVDGIREGMIVADYFQSEEWHDIFRHALEANVRVSDDKRRDAIARILVATASGNAPPNVEPVSLIAVLGEMSESEALVLGGMWRVMQPTGRLDERPGYRFFNELKKAMPTVQMDGIGFVMARIARTGLTRSALAYDDELGNEPIYEFTPTGVSLMRFLNDKSQP